MRIGPRYFRKRASDASTSSNVDDEYPTIPESNYLAQHNQDLNVTGLREKKLMVLIVWLSVLSLFALIILIINILIINTLQMSHRGMQALKIYNYDDPETGKEESMVQFTAQKSHFEHVVVEAGHFFGAKNDNLNLIGSRIIVGEPTESTTKLLLQEGVCKFENVDDFLILNSQNSKTLFSANHPLVTIDEKIKKVATSHIITNKIRAPVNSELKLTAENLVFRGNEGIQVHANALNLTAMTDVAFNTSVDGSLYFAAKQIFVGNRFKPLSMSSSPALSASVEAYRLCICKTRAPSQAKLFLVKGNRPCIAPASICK